MNKKEIAINEIYSLIKEVVGSGGEFELYPKGTSMLPLIREKKDSVILISPETIKKGDIAFYIRDDGTFTLHRVVKVKNDIFTMCGDNQFVLEDGIRKNQIFAKVKSIKRDGVVFEANDKIYKKYLKKLPRMRFKRKARSFLSKIKRKFIKKPTE